MKKKNKDNLSLSSFFKFLWLITIITFVFQFFSIISHDAKISDFFLIAFISNIIVGVFSFLLAGLSIKGKTVDSFKHKIHKGNLLFLMLLYLLLNSIPAYSYFKQKSGINLQNTGVINPTTESEKTTQKDSQSESNNTRQLDSDPIIDCKSTNSKCYGATIKTRKSECYKITCCQIGNNWSVYESDSKCDEAQELLIKKSPSPRYTPQPTVTSSPNSIKTTPTLKISTPSPTQNYYNPNPTATPTTNQTKNQELINQCVNQCNIIGAGNERLITERAKAMGTINTNFYTEEIYNNNQWINTCVNNCYR